MARERIDPHEWLSFEDEDEERTWVFDATFLTSNWKCIFGNGCQGVLTGPAPELVQGCCSYGAHLVDKKDARRVQKAAATLTPEEWQNHGRKRTSCTQQTRRNDDQDVDDACIFFNKPDFPAGVGCAFHVAAARRGVNFMTLKPEVCWQLPLRREDQVDDDGGHVTSVIRQWDRRHWGKGGREFHWWCTEAPDAFVGHKPVYEEMKDELTEMVGAKIYEPLGLAPRGAGPPSSAGCAAPPPRRAPAQPAAGALAEVGVGGARLTLLRPAATRRKPRSVVERVLVASWSCGMEPRMRS